MSRRRVDLTELAGFVDQLESFEAALQAAVHDAQARAAQLHLTWSGDAARAHRQAQEQWQQGTAAMAEALAALRRIGRTAHGNYCGAIAANEQMWRDVR